MELSKQESSLYKKQELNEDNSISQGAIRYFRKSIEAIDRNDGASLKPAERFVRHWIEPLSKEIKEEKRKCLQGDIQHYRSIYGPILLQIDADRAALCTVREMLSSCMKEPSGVKVGSIYTAIGRSVIAEINYDLISKYGAKYIDQLKKRYTIMTPAKVNWWAKQLRNNNDDLEFVLEDRSVQSKLGSHLAFLATNVCSATDYSCFTPAFVNENRIGKKSNRRYITLSQKVLDDIENGHDIRKFLRPKYGPMIVAPKKWTDKNVGGYLKIQYPFVAKAEKSQKDIIKKANLAHVYNCLNAINSTPWRINRHMFETMQTLWDQGGNIGKMPRRNDIDLPPKPIDIDTNKKEKEKWKREAHKIYSHNHKARAKRLYFLMAMDVARNLVNENKIYFPHNFDFRGRVYPVPSYLNHQGDDCNRALLEFSTPNNPDMRWVKIHLANCCGIDKLNFDDRIAWVEAKFYMFEAWNKDPINNNSWQDVDKPLQALAAAHALFDMDAASRLPIQVDGSCNGLQHYAAMMRDPIGGKEVNLLPGSDPQDVYNTVCLALNPVIQKDSDSNNPFAMLLNGKITRKITKRPVMTSVYGVTRRGASKQIFEEIKDIVIEDDETKREASIYLSKRVLESIGQVCQGASNAMSWIQECSKIVTNSNQPVSWISPIGFPVVQPYYNWTKTAIQSKSHKFILLNKSKPAPVKKQKQIASSAPNFIHSIDASHMLMTGLNAHEQGIDFAGVHDSFWTQSGNMNQLQKILRNEFINLHQNKILEYMLDQFKNNYSGLNFPDPPKTGNLNINSVKNSEYFFS